MQDPELYLERLDVRPACPVRREQAAVLDADHRAYVNHEVFFFSNGDALERFKQDPLRYCGIVTDPVSEERFRPSEGSPRHDYKGRPYFFSSLSTLATFKDDPERFADPRRKMPEMQDPPEWDPWSELPEQEQNEMETQKDPPGK